MNFGTPAATAASTRFFVPSRRSRLVPASHSSYLRGLSGRSRSVSSLTTTSGFAASTAARTASASNASAIAACAPSASIASAFERVMPTTSWPRSSSCRTSGRPIAPLAPAMKTFIRRLRLVGGDPPGEAGQRREDQRDHSQREEVEPAGEVAGRVVHVDKVVDRMDRVLERREHEHRRAPRPPPHRDEEDHAERDVERGGVLDVVV